MMEEFAVKFTHGAAHVLWFGALVALAVCAFERLVLRSAAGRHAAHLVGMLLIALALPVAFVMAPVEMAQDSPPSRPAVEMMAGPAGSTDPAVEEQNAIAPSYALADRPVNSRADGGNVSGESRPAAVDGPDHWVRIAPWVTGTYLIGLVLMGGRMACGFAGTARLRRCGESMGAGVWTEALRKMGDAVEVKVRPALKWSRGVASPVVTGFVKPAILIPLALASRLSPGQIEAVLAHELAHLRRRDTWALAVQRAIETVLFFHPAVWWMSRRMEAAREEACDDLVLAAGCDPADYAEALLICSECRLERAGDSTRLAEQLAATGKGGEPLRKRVLRLLGNGDDGVVRLGRTGWLLGSMLAAGLALALAAGGVKGEDGEKAEPEGNPARAAMLEHARALAAGDMDSLEEFWVFEDDLEEEFGQMLAGLFARSRDAGVELVSMQPLGNDELFACFLVRNGPGPFASDPAPLFLTFHREKDKWRCPPPGDLQNLIQARRLSASQYGRRVFIQSLIAKRFGSSDLPSQIAALRAQADAFERLAGPPYKLSQYEQAAKQLKKQADRREALTEMAGPEDESWREVLKEGGKEWLPEADDFYLSFYLEADTDDPQARDLPMAESEDAFRVEPFPCLTEDAIREARVIVNDDRPSPDIDLRLTDYGAKLMGRITKSSVGRKMAIVIEGEVISAPVIQSAITGGRMVITGNFTAEEAKAVAEKLNAYRVKAREFLEKLEKESGAGPEAAPPAAGKGASVDKPVDGVEIKWAAAEHTTGHDDWPLPVLVLEFDVHNHGPHFLHFPEEGQYHQVEVDGQWYEWVDPRVIDKDSEAGTDSSWGSLLYDFATGDSHLKQQVRVAASWRAIPNGKEKDYAQRKLSGFASTVEDWGEELTLEPGTHQVRIAVLCPPARAGLHRMIRAVSKPMPVVIAEPAAKGGAAGNPDEKVREQFLTIERFARLTETERAKRLPEFYRGLPSRSLGPGIEMILSIYPHHILERNQSGDSYDGNTFLWAQQLADAAPEMSADEVADKLDGPLWLRVAARARALQVLKDHPEATPKLIAADLDSHDLETLRRANAVILSLELRNFTERIFSMWLADDERSEIAWGTLLFLNDPATLEPLLDRVAKNPRFLVRCSGLFLAPLAGKPAAPALVKLLDSPDVEIRYHAAYALQECRDARLARPAVRWTGEKEARFRFLAAHLVSRLPEASYQAVRKDLLPLLHDQDDAVRFYAVRNFAERKDPAAGPVILEELRSDRHAEQNKVWIMQAMSSLSNSTWNYDMHQWGPGSPGNREAIEKFEAWLEESPETPR